MSEREKDIYYGLSFGVGLLSFVFTVLAFASSHWAFFPGMALTIICAVICNKLDQ